MEIIVKCLVEFFQNDAARLMLSNLEYIVAGGGAAGAVLLLRAKKYAKISNDVTPYLVKISKLDKSISERSKSKI